MMPDDSALFVSIQHPGEGGKLAAPTSTFPDGTGPAERGRGLAATAAARSAPDPPSELIPERPGEHCSPGLSVACAMLPAQPVSLKRDADRIRPRERPRVPYTRAAPLAFNASAPALSVAPVVITSSTSATRRP